MAASLQRLGEQQEALDICRAILQQNSIHNYIMNAINVINPYKWNGMWVFDDPTKELYKEPLVSGADTMMDIKELNTSINLS